MSFKFNQMKAYKYHSRVSFLKVLVKLIKMKQSKGILISFFTILFASISAEVLQCDAFFGAGLGPCRLSTGRVEDNEPLQISNAYSNFTMFTFTNVSFNSIPMNMFSLYPNISSLYISKNKLNRLTASDFNECRELSSLFLYGNELKILDLQVFEKCKKLTNLYVNDNPITKIKKGITRIIKLEGI